MYLIQKNDDFPDVELAHDEPNGLLAMGADLSIERLLDAYPKGIFPWYSECEPILWWSPDPRAVLFPEDLRISRSLRKLLRKKPFTITFNQDFAGVIRACSEPRQGDPRTWISPEIMIAYKRMHKAGYARSVECWLDNRLVGGLYGIAIDRVFFGESMFSRVANASKVALVYAVKHLVYWGYRLIDCQVQSDHLDSMGAVTVPRRQFVAKLGEYCINLDKPAPWQLCLDNDKILE